MKRSKQVALTIAALAALPLTAAAHGTKDQAHAPNAAISTDQHAFGVAGDPKRARHLDTGSKGTSVVAAVK